MAIKLPYQVWGVGFFFSNYFIQNAYNNLSRWLSFIKCLMFSQQAFIKCLLFTLHSSSLLLAISVVFYKDESFIGPQFRPVFPPTEVPYGDMTFTGSLGPPPSESLILL